MARRKQNKRKPPAEFRTLSEALVPMVDQAVRYNLSETAAQGLAKGLVALCQQDEQSCREQLQRPEDADIVQRRFFLHPLLHCALYMARLPYLEALRRAKSAQGDLWIGTLRQALGAGALGRILIGSYRQHTALARAVPNYALFLVRMSDHWRRHEAVRAQLQPLQERIDAGTATRQERRKWKFLSTPIDPSEPFRTGSRGRPTTSIRDSYAVERRTELPRRRYLHTLYGEVSAIFAAPASGKALQRQMRQFVAESPLWVELTPGFLKSPLGKCLELMRSPPLGDTPYVRARLAPQQTD